MVKWNIRAAGLLAAVALAVAACGGGDDNGGGTSSSASKPAAARPVTINWWHIANNDPLKTIWKQAADQYMAAHPNVTVKITVLENEAFKAKLTTTMQAGKPPDVFQSWGGGLLKEQADAGLVKDVTAPTKSWINDLNDAGVGLYQIDGKQYGVPYNLGLVGVWYNNKLFKKAGIDAPPTTWDEFLADVQKLKQSGTTPIAVGEKDKWPGMFWWANLSLRVAGKDAMAKAATDGSTFNEAGFVEAGTQLKKLIDMKPFEAGYLASPWDGAGGEAVDFVKFLVTSDVANKAGASGAILPVKKGSESSVTDPNMKTVLDTRAKSSLVQLYLDQAYPPAVGQAVNDAVQQLLAGKASPEEVSKKIANAAKAG